MAADSLPVPIINEEGTSPAVDDYLAPPTPILEVAEIVEPTKPSADARNKGLTYNDKYVVVYDFAGLGAIPWRLESPEPVCLIC